MVLLLSFSVVLDLTHDMQTSRNSCLSCLGESWHGGSYLLCWMLMLLILWVGKRCKETGSGTPEVLSSLLCQVWLWVTTRRVYYFTFCSGCVSRVQTIWGKYISHCDQVQWPLQLGSHFWSGLWVLLKCKTVIDKNKLKLLLTLRPSMQPHTPCTSSALEMQSPSLWLPVLQENSSHKCHLLNHWVAEVLRTFRLIINSWETNVKE